MAQVRPRPAAEDFTWQSRLASLRYVRPMLRLVWETSPPLVVATALLRIVRALMPLALLWIPKLILDAVVVWITRRGGSTADGRFRGGRGVALERLR